MKYGSMRRNTLYSRISARGREDWQRRSCSNKLRHATIEAAEMALRALELKGEQELNVYWCLWCFSYHVGHDKKGT